MSEQDAANETPAPVEPAPTEKPKKATKEPKPAPARPEHNVQRVALEETRKVAETAPHVYTAINEVKKVLAKYGGITKDRRADFGDRYSFRGIDDMYNVCCELTAKAGLLMFPRVVDQRIEREEGRKGGLQTHVWFTVEVDYVSQVDGSKHTACFVGEAIDTSDKASNKALSAAFKYAHLTVFQIPTHGEETDDTENWSTPVAAPVLPPAKATPAPKTPKQDFQVSDALADWAVDAKKAVAAATSAAELFSVQKAAATKPEPMSGVVNQAIWTRAMELMQETQDLKVLQGFKGLIEAYGRPAALLNVYSGRYAVLRAVHS